MKRRAHLKRTELSRTSRLIRQRLERAEPKPRARRRDTGPTAAVRALVWERDGACCGICGLRGGPNVFPPHQVHHRRPRAAGGTRRADTNSPANLVVLCATCHRWVESEREDGFRLGYLIHQDDDPATVQLRYRGRWVLLLPDGTVTTEETA